MTNNQQPLKIALYGFKEELAKAVMDYFKGPCQGMAITTTDPKQADADMFDANVIASRILLEERLKRNPPRPIIVVALQDYQATGVLHVKKPFKASEMISALEQVRRSLKPAELTEQPLDTENPQAVTINPVENRVSANKAHTITPTDNPFAETVGREKFVELSLQVSEDHFQEILRFKAQRKKDADKK